ncbi:hypothetical protein [Kitasatospora sp. NPDC005856]|uniref:hypothetical protein n=1 Tax=Kitasatospora sp. NPDC005856 TaxID=3154566 RepID=UPI0033D82B1F
MPWYFTSSQKRGLVELLLAGLELSESVPVLAFGYGKLVVCFDMMPAGFDPLIGGFVTALGFEVLFGGFVKPSFGFLVLPLSFAPLRLGSLEPALSFLRSHGFHLLSVRDGVSVSFHLLAVMEPAPKAAKADSDQPADHRDHAISHDRTQSQKESGDPAGPENGPCINDECEERHPQEVVGENTEDYGKTLVVQAIHLLSMSWLFASGPLQNCPVLLGIPLS